MFLEVGDFLEEKEEPVHSTRSSLFSIPHLFFWYVKEVFKGLAPIGVYSILARGP